MANNSKLVVFCSLYFLMHSFSANANVNGMSKNQLASFAQNQITPQYVVLPNITDTRRQPVESNTNTVTSLDKDVILMQLDMRNNDTGQPIAQQGFSTVKLNNRRNNVNNQNKTQSNSDISEVKLVERDKVTSLKNSTKNEKDQTKNKSIYDVDVLVKKIANNEIDVDLLTSKLKAEQQARKDSSNLQANNVIKQDKEDDSNWMIKVSNPVKPQPPTIQRASFVSPQVLQGPTNLPSQAEILGNNSYLVKQYTKNSSRPPLPNETQYSAHGPATIDCVMQIANKYQVPIHVLLAIQSQERGLNGQAVKNTNGSYDMGHFQINTVHFKGNGVFSHLSKADVLNRGCYNAELAAWLLRDRLSNTSYSQDFWKRAAAYHSYSQGPNQVYRASILKYAQQWMTWLQSAKYKTF